MRKTFLSLVGVIITTLAISPLPYTEAQTAPSETTVLVLPFSAPSDASAWTGKAVQQDLLADLTQGTNARVLAPADLAPALDAQAALKAGRDLGAAFVIFGQSQSTSKEVRLTGALPDVTTGKPAGALKATGPSDELFHLEDALAGQIFAAVPQTLLKAQANIGNRPLGAPPAPQSNQTPSPTSVYVAPPVQDFTDYSPSTEPYPTYTNNYYYQTPDYGYSPAYTYDYPAWSAWPYWGTGVVILGNGFNHHFHDHNGFHHDDGHEFRSSGGGVSFGTAGLGRGNESHFTPLRSGISSGGIARQNFGSRSAVSPRMSSGGFHGGGFHAASGGGFHGFSGGGARSGGGHR